MGTVLVVKDGATRLGKLAFFPIQLAGGCERVYVSSILLRCQEKIFRLSGCYFLYSVVRSDAFAIEEPLSHSSRASLAESNVYLDQSVAGFQIPSATARSSARKSWHR